MVPCVWWSVPHVRFILELSPMSLTISGPAIIHRRRAVGMSVRPTAPAWSPLIAALFCSWAWSIRMAENWIEKLPARVVGVVHGMDPHRQLSQGVQVHLEGSLAHRVNVHQNRQLQLQDSCPVFARCWHQSSNSSSSSRSSRTQGSGRRPAAAVSAVLLL